MAARARSASRPRPTTAPRWTSGLLPGMTKYTGGGTNDRATDAAVAYDARHNVWLISSLTLLEAGGVKASACVTSRSTDGGLTWGTPVTEHRRHGDLDKNWIVCDNTATSPFYGNCYTQWDDHGAGNRLEMSRSTDGGLTWSAADDEQHRRDRRPAGRPSRRHGDRADRQRERDRDRRVQLHQRRRELERRHHDRDDPPSQRRRQPARGPAALGRDRRRRHGLRRLDGLPLPQGVQGQRHRAQPLAQRHRHELVGGEPRADRRHQQRHRPLHPRPGRQQGDIGRHGAARPDLLLLPARAARSSASASSPPRTPAAPGARRRRLASGMPSTWAATTSQGRMVGDYISTSYGSDNLAHGVFATASAPTRGIELQLRARQLQRADRHVRLGSRSQAAARRRRPRCSSRDSGNANAQSLWNVVDNNGSKHRD